MLQQLVVNRIEWLPGCVDAKRQRNREWLSKDLLGDNALVALEQRAVCAVYRDGAGGLKQDAALRAMVGGDGVGCHAGRFYTNRRNPTKTTQKIFSFYLWTRSGR